jgi:hypothetical protein
MDRNKSCYAVSVMFTILAAINFVICIPIYFVNHSQDIQTLNMNLDNITIFNFPCQNNACFLHDPQYNSKIFCQQAPLDCNYGNLSLVYDSYTARCAYITLENNISPDIAYNDCAYCISDICAYYALVFSSNEQTITDYVIGGLNDSDLRNFILGNYNIDQNYDLWVTSDYVITMINPYYDSTLLYVPIVLLSIAVFFNLLMCFDCLHSYIRQKNIRKRIAITLPPATVPVFQV